jgi:hypothetical protein
VLSAPARVTAARPNLRATSYPLARLGSASRPGRLRETRGRRLSRAEGFSKPQAHVLFHRTGGSATTRQLRCRTYLWPAHRAAPAEMRAHSGCEPGLERATRNDRHRPYVSLAPPIPGRVTHTTQCRRVPHHRHAEGQEQRSRPSQATRRRRVRVERRARRFLRSRGGKRPVPPADIGLRRHHERRCLELLLG